MKRLFTCGFFSLLLTISLPPFHAGAQNLNPDRLIRFDDSSPVSLVDGKNLLHNELANGNRSYDFQLTKTEKDKLGVEYRIYQQYFKGLKVAFGMEKLHAKNGKVVLLTGDFYDVSSLTITPGLSSEEAFEAAKTFVGATTYLWEDARTSQALEYEKPEGELLILPDLDHPGKAHLAYKFDIYATDPISRDDIYIDANTGETLLVNNIIKHLGEHKHAGHSCHASHVVKREPMKELITGNAATRYSGSRSIETRIIGGLYALRDNTRGNGINTYNSGRSNSYPTTNFVDNDNNWTAAEHDNAFKDNGALDAHWGAEATYDYWMTQHNRNSFDGNGAAINSWVHYDNQPGGAGYDNAFWNGRNMTYGDGNQLDILTSLDVAAHEIGHAVTTNTGNMVYRRESGALNEGFSDIWGAAVEHFARGGADNLPNIDVWQIGEDLNNSGGIRSMDDPKAKGDPDTYRGVNWVPATIAEGCASPNSQNDQCGVHSNSGVLNHWFYILVVGKTGTNDIGNTYSVSGIGMTKAAEVAYRLLRIYLRSNSDFADARAFGIQSAEDLFGPDSPEVIATTNAWYAVGVGNEYGGGGPGGGCASTITAFPYSESFENSLGGWTQATGDDLDWTVDSNGTPSSGTGPSNATEGTFYIYLEVSGSGTGYPDKQAILNSPCFELTSSLSASFDYHMIGSSVGTIDLEISTDEGSTWTSIWSRSGAQGTGWNTASVDLDAYSGNTVQFRFNGISSSSWQGDIAIDNFQISTGNGGGTPGCTGGIASFPYSDGFENTLGNWSNASGDDLNWQADSNGTPSNNTGPGTAVQGSFYLYVEVSGNGTGYPNKRAILNSDCFDLTTSSAAFFNFSYHMYGATNMGRLDVEVSSDDGATWTNAWSQSGNQGNAWQTASLDLNAYLGGGIQIRFNTLSGATWQGDIAIDDVSLTTVVPASITSFAEGELPDASPVTIKVYPNPVSGSELLIRHSTPGMNYLIVNAA
ncbi:MAG: M4 family metallopeptidase, partial [Bacteroidota bacterium]